MVNGVYDLPRPYERHWNFLRLLKETASLKAATWVLTTTDKKALEAAVGASGVVDDEASVRDFLIATLERYGATVTVVETAHEALTTLQAWRPHVLVSDLHMPDNGGEWLIAKVRALAPERGGETPAACLTGLWDQRPIGARRRPR